VSPGAADRQPVTSCFVRLHCDERSALQIGFETGENVLNQLSDIESTQTLQSQTNHGRSTCPGERQDRVKVRVQGHYNGILFQRKSKYLLIGGLTHPDFPEVDALISETAQVGCGVSRNPLIED
jgi:hypothetical protein